MPFKDPKTGVLYPSKEWYQEKVDPETGQLYSSKVGNIKPDTEPYVKPEELEEIGDLKMPEDEAKEPDLTRARGRNNYWKKRAEEAEKEKEAKLKEYEQKLAEYEEESKSWLNKLTKQQTLTEKQQSLWEELGIKPADYFSEMQADIAEIDAMMDDYNKKEAQRDAALLRAEDRLTGMPGAILSGEQKAINKQYNLELNQIAAKIKSQSAIMEMKRGNFQEARSFVKEAVQNYTYDLELKYTQFEMFKEENKEVLADLRQDYRDALDEAETAAYNEWVQAQEEKEAVLNLQLQYAGAGITIDDTLEEATKKAEEWQISQPLEGTGLTSQIVGGFEVLKDAAGNIISTRQIDTGIAGDNIQLTPEGTIVPEQEKVVLQQIIQQLPAGQQDGAYGAIASIKNARDIIDLLNQGVDTGPIAGRWQGLVQKFGKSSEIFDRLQSSMTSFAANYIKGISGVAVSEQEYKRLMKALPSVDKQENVNVNTIKELVNTIKNKYETQLGINFDMFPTEIPSLDSSVNYEQEYKQLYEQPSKGSWLQSIGNFLFGGSK